MKNKLLTISITAIGAVAVILASVAFGFHLGGKSGSQEPEGPAQPVAAMVEPAAAPETTIIEPPASIAIPGYDTITMKARQAAQEVNLYNPQRNTCYFVISLHLADGTELFRSGLITPGNTLSGIELAQPLEAGTYEGAILRYACFSMGDMQELNGSDVIFTLEVIR